MRKKEEQERELSAQIGDAKKELQKLKFLGLGAAKPHANYGNANLGRSLGSYWFVLVLLIAFLIGKYLV